MKTCPFNSSHGRLVFIFGIWQKETPPRSAVLFRGNELARLSGHIWGPNWDTPPIGAIYCCDVREGFQRGPQLGPHDAERCKLFAWRNWGNYSTKRNASSQAALFRGKKKARQIFPPVSMATARDLINTSRCLSYIRIYDTYIHLVFKYKSIIWLLDMSY